MEGGYLVEAFMPAIAAQAICWTVRIYTEDARQLVHEETIPMSYEPIFGVDVEDRAMLETRVEEILKELP